MTFIEFLSRILKFFFKRKIWPNLKVVFGKMHFKMHFWYINNYNFVRISKLKILLKNLVRNSIPINFQPSPFKSDKACNTRWLLNVVHLRETWSGEKRHFVIKSYRALFIDGCSAAIMKNMTFLCLSSWTLAYNSENYLYSLLKIGIALWGYPSTCV